MDTRSWYLEFNPNHDSSNAFKILGNSVQVGGAGAEYDMDTVLRLDSPGSSVPCMPSSKGIKRKWCFMNGSTGQQVGSSLSLGLGRSSSSSDSKGSSATACTTMSSAKETDEESSMDLELDFSLHIGGDKVPSPKEPRSSNLKPLESLSKVGLELSLSTGPTESDITSVHPGSTPLQLGMEMSQIVGVAQHADEGSTSCRWKPGIVFPLQTPIDTRPSVLFNDPTPIFPDLSSTILTPPKSSVTCTSGITQQQQSQHRGSSSKTCQVEGCGKGARGASGRCISHGGGRRCQRPGCPKGAEGRTVYCKAHGGGRRCEYLGCTKSAEGRTDFCIAHGGGRRCSQQGCTRAARGKSGLCIRHGGGKRCQKENCTKSAEGLSGLCISHGGGRRCQAAGCTKGAQGSTMFCKAHGGGKRCTAPGCTKGAEGSTPFCKGHGGGKRCSWGHLGSEYGIHSSGPCNSFARGKSGLCTLHSGLVQDKRVHGGATLGPMVQDPNLNQQGREVITRDMNVDVLNIGNNMGALAGRTYSDSKQFGVPIAQISVGEGNLSSVPVYLPEGRVHGGSLIALLTSSSGLGSSSG
ncbi:hypothetical protein I3842_12G085800 [Carya illinoinensis]|uniref:WRKY19-like zinc finger domain-containing protein n=1 Tax=Carya illinoinensis TaxID=32201 RepID=A0A922IX05_CARIL|nr:hypothetical protein I3842_12G085800 [Carya illinoinensis]